ncbi:CDP-glucose 4,6-dehydratase [Legionella resiliens]|uniref:CDP-glucose 4,6-dehydratase n=1 Tax=Legionella resiliens TaxID=2905958 RepID=A0ABS8X3G6_9GAMM|nr:MULTISPECIES: CDP-glucose 4,6-dehydratase [unclassified Legionella]MCE0723351.1 CDP-glucose 4,6-dehydratase [Legionella sp. 9fVS26]MCE3532504.1 CDP-glucose 4,6-dehydratase [Legionella sp. 8cVS16]
MYLLPFEQALAGKKILVTGHTGFTGGWTSLWLQQIGASVAGFSLPPDTKPSLFDVLQLEGSVLTTFGDICNFDELLHAVEQFQPDVILHLAAQALVRRSYHLPVRTFLVNTQGTAHVLEAARLIKCVRAVLCVTTDKVYQNHEWLWPYRENDPLGGKDPYSASKAAAEMVIHSYSTSYPFAEGKGPAIATARGGNIIGGGDWSEDRLIPDFVRAIIENTPLTLRFPDATRPWQHVLALIHGYLMLMAGLLSEEPNRFSRPWNLGPQEPSQYTVRNMLDLIGQHWAYPELNYMQSPLPEAGSLALDSTLARETLGWRPVWDTQRMIAETALWYRDYYHNPGNARQLTLNQIQSWREGIGK